MERTLGLAALALVSALTTACAGSSAAGPADTKSGGGTQPVEVKATDALRFEPATITVKRGTPVQLTLVNSGALEHNWVVDSLGGKRVELDAQPKTSASVEFTTAGPGSYEFYCSIPGHREGGMKGSLVVH
jgi:plastocyanin